MPDSFKTIAFIAEGTYSEKRSKFLAFAIPVTTVDEVKQYVAEYQKRYYDARHACYAYMLGAERTEFRANDNGEPSGTAGKPILGQINSYGLTNILIIVVRYFGGIKLGTSGLIVAYRQAAIEALEQATIVERTVDDDITFAFEFPMMNAERYESANHFAGLRHRLHHDPPHPPRPHAPVARAAHESRYPHNQIDPTRRHTLIPSSNNRPCTMLS